MSRRYLVVSNLVPWPEVSGTSVRAAATIRALATLGRVDLFCILHPAETRPVALPEGVPVDRQGSTARSRGARGVRRFRWLVRGDVPREMATIDYAAARDEFQRWLTDGYDLVWMTSPEGFVAVGDIARGPVVVNLNDVETHKIDASLDTTARGLGPRQSLRLNRRRWRSFYERMAKHVDKVVVCSDLDRERLGVPNTAVVPNIYPAPRCSTGRPAVGEPPTVSIIGQLHYAPNADAARFFVDEVLPRLRAAVPDVAVRLVGEPDDSVRTLANVSGVTVTGLVPDITTELARADVCAVPIKFGGGTRIKILEAFAHRIPVVSTTLGAEGLGVKNGEHLVVADDAMSFAAGCAELLQDEHVRTELTGNAHRHWEQRYTEEALINAVAAVASDVAKDSA